MIFTKAICLFLAFFIATLCSIHAYVIDVGGSRGWTLNPPEAYNIWAERMRFSVNDTLHFKYNKAIDSVLLVSKDDFDNCNSDNPITKLDDGASAFTFDRSGPYYFITGNKTHCDKGQKFHLIVLTVRNNQPPSPPSADTPASPSSSITISPPGAAISPAPEATTTFTPADLNAPPPFPSSARQAFNAASTVSFVMISLALVGFTSSA